VRWTSLGHACWLIEADGLRLLCDPLVGVEHHGGVFEVSPRRRLRAEALRPDFILVSHRHPDHFDIPSLATLARLDPETVLVTPDELVAWAARELGFRSVKLVGAGQRVELDGPVLVTTESVAEDEWGVMVATGDGVVWNMVDTVLRDVEHARALTRASLEALGRARVDLALVQGQPMLEIAAQLGRGVGFPFGRYADNLAQLAAIDPAAIVPSAAGTVHAPAYAWLNAFVYPVDETRFRRDAARVCPEARIFASQLGARYTLAGGELERDEDASLFEALEGGPRCEYRPVEIPAVEDPGELDTNQREQIESWVVGELREALARVYGDFGVRRPLRFVLELAGIGRAWTLIVDARGATVVAGFDPGWDVYNLVAASLFAEVIAGRRHWGDLLLGGALRGFSRAYELGPAGLEPANVAELFVYYALSYEESTRRAVAWELARAKGEGEGRAR
jgi:UDP-MurNAc hydroxylase